MPFISDAQIARVSSTISKFREQKDRIRAKAEQKMGEAVKVGETVMGGALAGYVQSRFSNEQGAFVVPGTQIDGLLAGGLALVAIGYLDVAGKFDDDAMHMGSGMLAYHAGQKMNEIGRKAKETGKIFGYLPNESPYVAVMGGHVGAMTDSELAARLRSY